MMTANSGMRDPDHYFIDSFALYDPSEKVSEGHNQHFHEAHKKKAIHDVAIFNHEHLARDLLHYKDFQQNHSETYLIKELPEEMGKSIKNIKSITQEMELNINYFYKLTQPLINHKTYDKQMEQLSNLTSNFTALEEGLRITKEKIDEYEKQLHTNADEYFEKNDKNMMMGKDEKDNLFDETMIEWQSSIKMIRNKFNRIKEKMNSVDDFTKTFHETSDKLEKLYLRDIQKRKEYYQEHDTVNKALDYEKGALPNLAQVNKVYDDIVAEESSTVVSLLFRVPNLLMLAVIGLCFVLQFQLTKFGNKNRLD